MLVIIDKEFTINYCECKTIGCNGIINQLGKEIYWLYKIIE